MSYATSDSRTSTDTIDFAAAPISEHGHYSASESPYCDAPHISDAPLTASNNPNAYPTPWESGNSRPYGRLANWTLEYLRFQNLQTLRFAPIDVGKIDQPSINGKFRLWASEINVVKHNRHIATCRMVLIQGSSNEIINTWVFPTNPMQHPVFAAELIAMARAPRLSFIDVQVPALQSNFKPNVRQIAKRVRQQFPELLIDEVPPEWAIAESEGQYVFSRSLDQAFFASIAACYQAYLSAYFGYLDDSQAIAAGIPASHAALTELQHYQDHHRISSPGGTFLGKLFGEDWTDAFLQNFLFTGA